MAVKMQNKAYIILGAFNAAELSDYVNNAIIEGYQPLGGFGIDPEDDDARLYKFYQPMIKLSEVIPALKTAYNEIHEPFTPPVFPAITIDFNHFHVCPSCKNELGCNEDSESDSCWLGLAKLAKTQNPNVPAILDHKCGPYRREHNEQCGYVAINDEIWFCDRSKGHTDIFPTDGHSLRKVKNL